MKDNAIARITPEGIELADGTRYDLDVIILATGFDAGTGALTRIDIRGRGGRSLREDWGRDIRTTMGLMVHGYPNMFTTAVPLAPSGRALQHDDLPAAADGMDHRRYLHHARTGQVGDRAMVDAEEAWVRHHDETAGANLISRTNSWYLDRTCRQAAPRAVLYRGRGHLSPQMRRGGRGRLSQFRDGMTTAAPAREMPARPDNGSGRFRKGRTG